MIYAAELFSMLKPGGQPCNSSPLYKLCTQNQIWSMHHNGFQCQNLVGGCSNSSPPYKLCTEHQMKTQHSYVLHLPGPTIQKQENLHIKAIQTWNTCTSIFINQQTQVHRNHFASNSEYLFSLDYFSTVPMWQQQLKNAEKQQQLEWHK